MAVMLYYPQVNPPTEVLHQALLYWDSLATLVPRDSRIREAALHPDVRELRDRGLYTPLTIRESAFDSVVVNSPLQHHSAETPAFEVALEELRRIAAEQRSAPRDRLVYLSKLTYRLEAELRRLGLGERLHDRMFSLSVPREVQEVLIGAIVRDLVHEQGPTGTPYFPCTDRPSADRLALRPTPLQRSVCWEVEIGRLLPLPAVGTPTPDVLAFRERYDDERRRLMRAVHRLLGGLRRDYEHPADVLAQLRGELAEAVDDYRSAAKSVRIAWVTRSLTVTVGLASASAAAMALPDLGWVLGTVGAYAINVATREIRPVRNAAKRHDFSYLHRIDTTLV